MCVKTTKNYFAAYTWQKQPTFHLRSALSPKIIIDLGGQNWLQSENITKRQNVERVLAERARMSSCNQASSILQASERQASKRKSKDDILQASVKQARERAE